MSTPADSDQFDHERGRADHHRLWEWEHSEEATYWLWVERIALEREAASGPRPQGSRPEAPAVRL